MRANRLDWGRRIACGESGQMTVELMAVLPVALIIAVIVVNALVFFGDCAAFDRVARNAVRVYATSPTYGAQAAQSQANVLSAVQAQACETRHSRATPAVPYSSR